jgi:hypothetical protein
VLRGLFIASTGALFVAALAIPKAWGASGHGLSSPLVLAVALSFVRLAHIAVCRVAAGGDLGPRRQLARTTIPVVLAALLLVVGAVVGGPGQTALWAVDTSC